MKDQNRNGMVMDDYRGIANYEVNGTSYGPSQGSQAVFHLLLVILGKLNEIERRLDAK